MAKYECSVCGFIYDEQAEGKRWPQLPGDWICPVCGAVKSEFEQVAEGASEEVPEVPGARKPEKTAASVPDRVLMGHRVFGYVFLTIYFVLLIQMLPRLWTYQIEFPARTVIHIALGMAVGVVLVLKITIVRFFRRLETSLVPGLGTFLLVGSVVLIGISVPAAFREAFAMTTLFEQENLERVRTLLAQAELDAAECQRLATPESLRAGQRVLRQDCIDCHDLRTVLARPRTPMNWRQTVARMADRTTLVDPLEEEEQLQVTAYLVAISPQLQRSAQQMRQQQREQNEAKQAAADITAEQVQAASYDPAVAKQLFEKKCSQCHVPTLVKHAPPSSEEAARELVKKMVAEGLKASEGELSQIIRYIVETYAKNSEP